MGFGSTLIGETVDYAIYYLIQARGAGRARAPAGSAGATMHWPTVRLGLLTSVCGFAALVFSGFPGLAQLGVFSLAGLIAAALVARYVLPVLAPDGATGMGMRRQMAQRRRRRWCARCRGCATSSSGWASPRWRWCFGRAATCGAPSWRDEPGAQGRAGARRRAARRHRRQRRRHAGRGARRRRAGRLARRRSRGRAGSTRWSDKGELAGFETVTRLLPSEAAQAARIASLPDARALRTRLAEATQGLPLPAARLEPFIADVEAARAQPHDPARRSAGRSARRASSTR